MIRTKLALLGLWMFLTMANVGRGAEKLIAEREIYDPKANNKAIIADAVTTAGRENRRVLLVYGGNWCGWCIKLHKLFHENPEVRKALYDYIVVPVDSNSNKETIQKYGAQISGFPYLTVLDANDKVVVHQETASLEEGDHHDPKKVAAFLNQWKAGQQDAEEVLKRALEQAGKTDKKILLHVGAPWCGWCRRLDALLAMKPMADSISVDYLDVKIDLRMPQGETVYQRLCKKQGGIPWMAILDTSGKVLITSDGPNGNIGYPAKPDEIEYFCAMLQKTAKRLTAQQIDAIKTFLLTRKTGT